MSYRPITDVWILARSKVKFFGAYPAGFLQRARDLLSVTINDQVLHVCSGKIRDYPYKGFGPNDITMDLEPALGPDYALDAKEEISYLQISSFHPQIQAVLADPPYTLEWAHRYTVPPERFPTAAEIVEHSLKILPIGGRVGILSLSWPRYPKTKARQVAVVAVYVGNGNHGRTFAVFERTA